MTLDYYLATCAYSKLQFSTQQNAEKMVKDTKIKNPINTKGKRKKISMETCRYARLHMLQIKKRNYWGKKLY